MGGERTSIEENKYFRYKYMYMILIMVKLRYKAKLKYPNDQGGRTRYARREISGRL